MQRRKHIKAIPNNITALVKTAGPVEAANSLGITPSAIKAYIRHKSAPKSTEIAAGSLLGTVASTNVTAVVQCPQELLKTVKLLLEANGGNITVIKY